MGLQEMTTTTYVVTGATGTFEAEDPPMLQLLAATEEHVRDIGIHRTPWA